MNKLLVIDDDSAIRKSLALTFENSRFAIDTAESGLEGISKVKSTPYSLIFIDLKMPGLNGIETLRSIREFNKDVIIYIFTAFHREFFRELEKAAVENLNFEVVNKPVDSHQLLELVRNTLINKE